MAHQEWCRLALRITKPLRIRKPCAVVILCGRKIREQQADERHEKGGQWPPFSVPSNRKPRKAGA